MSWASTTKCYESLIILVSSSSHLIEDASWHPRVASKKVVKPFMLTKRRFVNDEQKMQSGFSIEFSMDHGPN
jgi:hypothetical protein